MATRPHLVIVAICSVVSYCAASSAALAQATVDHTALLDAIVRTLPGEAGDQAGAARLRSTVAELMQRSWTFADLVQSLGRFGNTTLVLSPASLPNFLGKGTYRVSAGRITGVITVNPYLSAPGMRVRALAHEFAHAFEIACLSPTGDTATLRQQLGEHLGRRIKATATVETPFARSIENAVAREWSRSVPGSTQLPVLAANHGLDRCQSGGVSQIAVRGPQG